MKFLKILSLLLALLLLTSVFASCSGLFPFVTDTEQSYDTQEQTESESGSDSESGSKTDPTTDKDEKRYLNGISIDEYTIVYSAKDEDYGMRAAKYIQDQIKSRTGIKIELQKDSADSCDHEIVVGETSRPISESLNAPTPGLQFAIYANDDHIAMEGDYFIIAAAAYFFIETYVNDESLDANVPKEISVHEPIVKEAKNFILLIGDGMGFNQTLLFEVYDAETEGSKAYSDGEDIFYGYMLPYKGSAITTSLSGTTDSAAGGTALATGYKTYNSRVGKDKNNNDIQSLTELAGSMGMATAVMSTDDPDGATPASFSSHAESRKDSQTIKDSQDALKLKYDTIIDCGNSSYNKLGTFSLENRINKTLDKLSDNEKGFFIMYEEAHIDKHSHSSDMDKTFNAVVRFNQAIGIFMEYAFYNPDTFVLITADHETGGLKIDENGDFAYTSPENSEGSRNHTGANVPVFAYGIGAEVFNNATVENVEIPQHIARLMGVDEFGGPIHTYDYF